jgi:hypothetical protein
MEYCSKKLEPTEMCFGVLIHTNMKTFDQRGSWPFSTTKYENVHGVRIQCKYEFTCGDDWTLSTPTTHGNMLGVLIHAKIWTSFG